MKLNIGCATNKIEGATNIDINPNVNPDLVVDIRNRLPFNNESFDEIYFFHTVEHIEKKHHYLIFKEIRRVLRKEGVLYVSYPEFGKILENWLRNKDDNRLFWEATIYGRQLYPGDYHVSAMDSLTLSEELREIGFNTVYRPERGQDFNTVMVCHKTEPLMSYEEVLYNEVFK